MRFFSEPQKEPKPEPEDGGQDLVGQNPTGRDRKSSAGQRRKKERKLFGGTKYEEGKK